MTATAPSRRRTPAAPPESPPDPLAGIACCEGCGAVLFEDLLGRLSCAEADCDRQGEVVGKADVDVGVLTAEAIATPAR
jgi:hypothetical protein